MSIREFNETRQDPERETQAVRFESSFPDETEDTQEMIPVAAPAMQPRCESFEGGLGI